MLLDNSEKELKNFINELIADIKHRKYSQVEEKISLQEELFVNFPSFFNLIHLKIRSIFKQIIELMNLNINYEKYSTHQIDKLISSSIDHLNLLIKISQSNSLEQFEIITRLYLELAYINSFISRIRNEGYNSLAMNCYALNIMKLFLHRVLYPIEIRTYYYYQVNMLLVSKQLIEDNDYETAKQYQFNCLQIAIQALCLIDPDNNDFLYSPYFNKLMEGIVITLLHRGICEENLKNIKQALEAYKQAKYFSSFLDIERDNKLFLFNLCSKVFQIAYNSFEDKILISDFYEKNKEKTRAEKTDKMFFISQGYTYNVNRFKRKESELNKIMMNNTHNNKDHLLMFVNDHIKNYRHFSPETKSNLAHFALYNKLLSSDYKKFVAVTNNFEYNHPNKQKENIEAIEKYINSKIYVQTATDKELTQTNNDINSNTKTSSNPTYINTNTNSYDSTKRNTNPNSRLSKYLSTSPSCFMTQNTQSKLSTKFINPYSVTYKDHPVTQEEKYILSNNFKLKLNHIDSLSQKELKFQKMMLKFKRLNCPEPKNQVKDLSKIKEEVYQSYNLLKIKMAIPKKESKANIMQKISKLSSQFDSNTHNINLAGFVKMRKDVTLNINKNEKRVYSQKCNIQTEVKAENYNRKQHIKEMNTDKITKLNREIDNIDNNMLKKLKKKKMISSFSYY